MKIGTKAQAFNGGKFDDHGEAIESRRREAVVRWHGSGKDATALCADLVDLVVEMWSRGIPATRPRTRRSGLSAVRIHLTLAARRGTMLRTAAALYLLFGVSMQAVAAEASCLESAPSQLQQRIDHLLSCEVSCLESEPLKLQECKKIFHARKQAEISRRTRNLVETVKEQLAGQREPAGGTPWSPTATERIRGSIPHLRY